MFLRLKGRKLVKLRGITCMSRHWTMDGTRMENRGERTTLSSYSAMMTARPKDQRVMAFFQLMMSIGRPARLRANDSTMGITFARSDPSFLFYFTKVPLPGQQ